MNGIRLADVIRRINLHQTDSNWLSLHYSSVKVVKYSSRVLNFGEVDQYNNLHGRGICIQFDGNTGIGYFDNGNRAPGNFIHIKSGGNFIVGECYLKDG